MNGMLALALALIIITLLLIVKELLEVGRVSA
jgi:hypothetical protein